MRPPCALGNLLLTVEVPARSAAINMAICKPVICAVRESIIERENGDDIYHAVGADR